MKQTLANGRFLISYPSKQTTDRNLNKEFYSKFEVPPEIKAWHDEGFQVADAYERNEYRSVELLSFMARQRGYLHYKCESLTQYARFVWVLQENAIRDLVTVAKKAIEIPEMLEALKRGHTTVSKLRKVCPVITPKNAKEWILLTEECTSREVERAVAAEKPEEGFKDQVRFISGDKFEMKSAISIAVMEKLERVADLLSTQKKRSLTNDEVLDIMTELVLEQIDPIRKAERAVARNEKRNLRRQTQQQRPSSPMQPQPVTTEENIESRDQSPGEQNASTRVPGLGQPMPQRISVRKYSRRKNLKAETKHTLNLRDKTQCTHINHKGDRCSNRRWLHTHHIKEVAKGGTDELENLTTLCSAHHRLWHRINEL